MTTNLNTIANVCLLDDLLRPEYIHQRGFIYTAIEEPIKQALNTPYPDTNFFPSLRGLSLNFDENHFRELCRPLDWVGAHHKLPIDAEYYLLSCIPENSLIISYETPPWLECTLRNNNIPFISLRISPFRFARDLHLCLKSNIPEIHNRLSSYHISVNELRIEAGLLRASAQQKIRNRAIERVENSFLFLGQTRADASLVSSDGKILSVSDFTQQIREITGNQSVGYKPHPYDKEFAKEELNRLNKILGRKATLISDNIYEILTLKSNVEFITISSGTCQEAVFFNKKAHVLHNFICNPYLDENMTSSYRFIDLLSPNFWRMASGKKIKLSERSIQESENIMRRFHDVWWGYSEYHIKNDNFWYQSFELSAKKYFPISPFRKFLRAVNVFK